MPPKNSRKYTDLQLACAVAESKTMREVVAKLGLVPCGANYENVRARMQHLGLRDEFRRLHRKDSPVRSVSEEAIRQAVPGARSRAEVLRRLSIETTAANNKALGLRLERLGIDCTHFLGRAANRGRKVQPRYRLPLSEVLVSGRRCSSTSTLKKRLFEAGLKTRECERCGISEWLGKQVALELHHINGDRADNRLENLQLLCPNCHSLTDTYRGRNIGRISCD